MFNKIFITSASALVMVTIAYVIKHKENEPRLAVEFEDKNLIITPSLQFNSPVNSLDTLLVEQEELSNFLQTTSLVGTKVDAANVFVVDGVIMIDHSLRFYYEYFLTLKNRLGLDKVRTLLAADARKRYESLAANYVIDLFRRYTDYLHEIRVLIEKKQKQVVLTVSEQQVLAKNLQVKIFNEIESQVLFNDEFLTAHDDKNTMQGVYNHYIEMQKQHPDASLEVLRVENFGVEVAVRLAVLDEKREQWKQRLSSYQCEKKIIEESEGLHSIDKEQGIEALQQRLFSEREMLRVSVWEKHQLMQPVTDCN